MTIFFTHVSILSGEFLVKLAAIVTFYFTANINHPKLGLSTTNNSPESRKGLWHFCTCGLFVAIFWCGDILVWGVSFQRRSDGRGIEVNIEQVLH
jgi:hypothetical protein